MYEDVNEFIKGLKFVIEYGAAYICIAIVVLSVAISVIVLRKTKDRAFSASLILTLSSGALLAELIILGRFDEIVTMGVAYNMVLGWIIIPILIAIGMAAAVMICVCAVGIPFAAAYFTNKRRCHAPLTMLAGVACSALFVFAIIKLNDFHYISDSFGRLFR